MSDTTQNKTDVPVRHDVNVQIESVPAMGMTLRDHFASHIELSSDWETGFSVPALMGEMPPQWSTKSDYEASLECAKWWARAEAKYRYLLADAMLAEREVKP